VFGTSGFGVLKAYWWYIQHTACNCLPKLESVNS